jgi:citronellol/citronellal dehydrogenase
MSLSGKTLFITGASRGIGLEIALAAARDGANIVVAAKTTEAHKHLPGTIYSAAEAIEAAGGKALPLVLDVRDDVAVAAAVDQAAGHFGGIDICVNNASAIMVTPVEASEAKRWDLMHQVNARGTFFVSKACIPHLRKAANPHVLMISPPLDMSPKWFGGRVSYAMSKYGMSMCVLGMAEEFKDDGIAFNALWPRVAVATSAIRFATGDDEAMRTCRDPRIMSEAAYAVLNRPARDCTGNFFIDDNVLYEEGVRDFDQYRMDPTRALRADIFVPETPAAPPGVTLGPVEASAA